MSGSGESSGGRAAPVAWIWWVVTGAAIGVGIVGLLTIGGLFLVLGLVMAVAGAAMRWTHNRSVFMAVAGASAGPLTLAWLNRNGPGTVCETSGDVTACIEQWSPWPFLVVAVVLISVGVALAWKASGRAASGS